MREFVGVKSWGDIATLPSLKQDALMFKQIVVPNLSGFLPIIRANGGDAEFYASELDWLLEQGVIFSPIEPDSDPSLLENEELRKLYEIEFVDLANMSRWLHADEVPPDEVLSRIGSWMGLKDGEYQVRRVCVQLRLSNQADAYPILSIDPHSFQDNLANKIDVVQIVLHSLPVPDDATPWEQIIEYRNDPNSQGKFLALRNWMSDMARAKLTQTELEEKIEWLMYDYKQNLELHVEKTNVKAIKTFVVASLDIVGDLVKLKWGKIAESFFALKERQLELIEGELKAPGREIAYVYDATQKFSRP